MEWSNVGFTVYELLMSIILSLLTIIIIRKIINFILFKIKEDEKSKDNIALSIFGGTLIVCVLVLVQSGILPSIDSLRVATLSGQELTTDIIFKSFVRFIIFYLVTLFFSSGIVLAAIYVYMVSTVKIDEQKEIKSGNIAVSVMMSMVLLGITLFIQPSLARFMGSLVNYEMTSAEQDESIINPSEEEMEVPLQRISPK